MGNAPESSLRLRDELYRLMQTDEKAIDFLMNGVLDGVWYADLENPEHEWLSPRYKELFGYADDEIDNPIGWWRTAMFPEDVEIADENFRRAVADPNYRYAHVVRFRHKDGRTIWVHCRGHLIRNAEGKPIRLLGCHVDATRLMEMEQVDRFGTIIENCITEIYVFDAETLNFLQVNSGARQRLGYTMAELKAMTPLDIKPIRKRSDFELIIAPLRRGEVQSVSFETFHICKNGDTYPIAVHYEFSASTSGSVFIAFITDISEKRARERELEATKELNDVILNSVSDGIAGLQPVLEDDQVVDYQIVAANHALRRQFHRFGGPLIGTRLTEIMPEFQHSVLFTRLKDVGERGAGFAVEIGPSEIGLEWYLVRAMRTAASGITITFINITDSKQREISLKKSNDALRQFSGIVSHDLQAPLRHISLFAEMLEGRLDGKDKEAVFIAGRIRENISRMQRMVTSLLDYTSVAYAQIRRDDVDLESVVEEVRRLLETDIATTGAMIDVGVLPTVVGDRELLVRLFQNLISNALKYRSKAPPIVRIDSRLSRGVWQVSVKDNGIGIDPRFSKRIFDVFTRLHRDEKTYPGMGIGLALCKQIVESHKGEIWLDASNSDGARFCFTFPAA
ncbi:PAS domain-containing sensor histidine kinase [Oryzibacter oryziterrae]|uniref:PAS domain-containing sensor histidine kinase n=1 Tax=Oryzibacter oryziterrae TaxID=2766474 RepID=UPI001F4617FC|nr:ATP-binding protein [Oryzibacter oryziterrae]